MVLGAQVVFRAVDLEHRAKLTPQEVGHESAAPHVDLRVLLEAADAGPPQQQPARPRLGHGMGAVPDVAQCVTKQLAALPWTSLELGHEVRHAAHPALDRFGDDSLHLVRITQPDNVVRNGALRWRQRHTVAIPGEWQPQGAAHVDASPALDA
jgi:hypothetical protein